MSSWLGQGVIAGHPSDNRTQEGESQACVTSVHPHFPGHRQGRTSAKARSPLPTPGQAPGGPRMPAEAKHPHPFSPRRPRSKKACGCSPRGRWPLDPRLVPRAGQQSQCPSSNCHRLAMLPGVSAPSGVLVRVSRHAGQAVKAGLADDPDLRCEDGEVGSAKDGSPHTSKRRS